MEPASVAAEEKRAPMFTEETQGEGWGTLSSIFSSSIYLLSDREVANLLLSWNLGQETRIIITLLRSFR